jgi:preprotein translocase SecE subunit
MKQISQFLKEVRVELSRVEWPKMNEWIGATIVTLILVVFFAIFLGGVDRGNKWVIYDTIFSRVRE